jgi:hypothetical protein
MGKRWELGRATYPTDGNREFDDSSLAAAQAQGGEVANSTTPISGHMASTRLPLRIPTPKLGFPALFASFYCLNNLTMQAAIVA